jgi:putative membrane protein
VGIVGFWAIVIGAIWYLVTAVIRRPEDRPRDDGDPRRILDERLARGEVDPEEYRRLRDLLEERDPRAHLKDQPADAGRRR